MNIKSFFGDKAFYKYVLGLTVPIMVQNFITNFVQMLDNIMVGRLGTAEMSGVSVANQLFFVFNLALFGMVSGAGIFGAQFAGNKDVNGLRNAFRFKVAFGVIVTFLFCWLFAVEYRPLIGLYLTDTSDPLMVEETLKWAKQYMLIMLVGLYPYAISMSYSSTLRETGETKVPMIASFAAVGFNIVFDYILIFGKFGAPRLGVAGAAIATVGSRFVELLILIIWTERHRNNELIGFIKGAFATFVVPKDLAKGILAKGTPLLLNETLWAAGITRLAQCYSQRSINVVAAQSISNTYFNLFAVLFLSMGSAIAIILGQRLGAELYDDIMDWAKKLIAFSFFMSFGTAAIFIACSFFIPELYETTPEVKHMATLFMIIAASGMPGDALCNGSYFTIRSGGKTLITFFMDSGFVWFACVLTATVLVNFTTLSIYWIYFIIQLLNYVKGGIGIVLTKKRIWINNIIEDSYNN